MVGSRWQVASGRWRAAGLRVTAVALVVGGVALVALIAGGAFDPRPLGLLVAASAPGVHTLDGRGEALWPRESPLPSDSPAHSIRLTAAYAGGEIDSGYGLALGDEMRMLVVAVSPAGYVAIWEMAGGSEPAYHLPWQTWPHARGDSAANEIWLDVERTGDGATVTARVNRELLWRGEIEALGEGASLWLGSFGGPVTVEFRSLEWFTGEKS